MLRLVQFGARLAKQGKLSPLQKKAVVDASLAASKGPLISGPQIGKLKGSGTPADQVRPLTIGPPAGAIEAAQNIEPVSMRVFLESQHAIAQQLAAMTKAINKLSSS